MTIIGEMAQSCSALNWDDHKHELGKDIAPILMAARTWKAMDYINAQRYRTSAIKNIKEIFTQVDVIATPTTACTAPLFSKEAQDVGESDVQKSTKIMRYAPLANLTGIPAIAIPFGYDSNGLPTRYSVNNYLLLNI